jgi:nucleotide-binding universal stress UspA family protein
MQQLAIPPRVVPGFDPDAMFRRILVPIDYDDACRCAVAQALGLRRHFGSAVHLFCMAELDEVSRFLAGTGAEGLSGESMISRAEDRLTRFVEHVIPEHAGDVSLHAGTGMDVAEGIASEARRVGATLVIVGSNPERHVFRTQIERVTQRIGCPVLLVRSPG